MGDPNKADINVILTPVTPSDKWPDGVKFEMQSGIGAPQKLTFNNDGKPGFKLKFKIIDDQKTGYLFPENEKDAMWVKTVNNEAEQCPGSAMYWPQFEATDVTDDYKTLKVRNRNDDAQLFKFTLLFTKTPEQNGPCIQYDPIGDNRNGAQAFIKPALAIAIGVTVIAVVALVAFYWLRG